MTKSSSSPKPKSVRQDLGEVISEVFDREFLEEWVTTIKGMSQGVWGEGRCPECDCPRKVMVQVPDLKGQLAAVTALLEQAEGRPGTQQGEVGGVTLIIERHWPGTPHQDQLQPVSDSGAGGIPPE